jgi:CheY-like chemotaxis protein
MRTIVVADDHAGMRQLVRHVLERDQEYQVLEAEDGLQALQLIRLEHPALAILDRQMPGLTGDQICVALKADTATRDIPILIMTADREDAVRGHMFTAGASAFLSKPFKVSELEATLKQLIGDPVEARLSS